MKNILFSPEWDWKNIVGKVLLREKQTSKKRQGNHGVVTHARCCREEKIACDFFTPYPIENICKV